MSNDCYFVSHPIYPKAKDEIKTFFDNKADALRFAKEQSEKSPDVRICVLIPAVGECQLDCAFLNGILL